MKQLSQSPTDPEFVQDPYPFYDRARALGEVIWWEDYGMPAAASHAAVSMALRDRRFARVAPGGRPQAPAGLAGFEAVERHSLLELEPPDHTRIRGLVTRAFTSRRIAGLSEGIARLSHALIDEMPAGPADLLDGFAARLPVTVIARLLGVPEEDWRQLLDWSHAMVAMYQARRDADVEAKADAAARDFSAYIRDIAGAARDGASIGLLGALIEAEADGDRLTMDELVATAILLLNAGHEATVHTIGNGVKALLERRQQAALGPGRVAGTVEEILRFDPPLHLFQRVALEKVDFFGTPLAPGDRVACLLAAANRDPAVWPDPARFDPARELRQALSFGAGLHFCLGAPLARLELQVALPILFRRRPGLRLAEPPRFADTFHFHGLARLMVEG